MPSCRLYIAFPARWTEHYTRHTNTHIPERLRQLACKADEAKGYVTETLGNVATRGDGRGRPTIKQTAPGPGCPGGTVELADPGVACPAQGSAQPFAARLDCTRSVSLPASRYGLAGSPAWAPRQTPARLGLAVAYWLASGRAARCFGQSHSSKTSKDGHRKCNFLNYIVTEVIGKRKTELNELRCHL